jgi:hypothetical protein
MFFNEPFTGRVLTEGTLLRAVTTAVKKIIVKLCFLHCQRLELPLVDSFQAVMMTAQ